MEPTTRDRMEASFGFDFGRVRVHDGARAAEAADALDAEAFTVGRDVVLGGGIARGSVARDQILAHELAHVMQQGARDAAPAGPIAIGGAGDPHEREADAAAHLVGSGSRARVTMQRSAPIVQRTPKQGGGGEEAAPPANPLARDDDFRNCSPEKRRELQDRANDARIWVRDAEEAVRAVGAGTARPEVKELFVSEFRFDPEDESARGYLETIQTSFARMKAGTERRLKFTCENREGGRAAQVQSGFLSCEGHISVYDEFFEPQLPGFEQDAEDIARDERWRTHVIVHELAHNLAGREGEVRPDYTPAKYGCERQWPSWDEMGARDAVNNAESYALFAQRLQERE